MNKLSKEQQTIIVVLIALVGFGYVYWNYLLKPIMAQISERQAKHADLVQKIDEAKRFVDRLPVLIADKNNLEIQLKAIEKQLPRDRDVPGIITLLTKEAQAEDLLFSSMRPIDPRKDNYFEVIEFEVTMVGQFHNLMRFMSSLGQQDRIFQFDKLNITGFGGATPGQEGLINLNFSFSVKTYAYVG